ncbi:hypothetical protein ANA_P10065 (plasmid) [Anabaena sp. 90]|uniref:hypothetical protein n=1 Tax=Anabaena sp. 90 TaxID=46234 RepID=UPI00029B70DB|nr:hypothetical protein [Anabaena sp. 90]AFW97233.1 hypothetical protein ANA_P10065 [Anabaena sp. 90]
MINDLPEFERNPINPEEPQDKEFFYPKWHCFCCQDSGLVSQNLVRLIIPNYDNNQDKWVLCQNIGCKASKHWENIPSKNFDTRFTPVICQKLDLKNRGNWHNTVQRQIDIRALTKTMAMPGVPDRTENDNREVQQRKQEAENFDWAAASTAYLGSE